jgi:putative transposase
MGHTFTNHLYHIVFSTKERCLFIGPEIRERLFQYICGIVRKKGGIVFRINGMEEHVHLLVKIKPDVAVAKFVGDIKGNSSRWISTTFPQLRAFTWQAGYSSFTVSESCVGKTAKYIEDQEKHHRGMPFAEELAKLLEKHRIEFDPDNYLD